jgi:hypothetical protein
MPRKAPGTVHGSFGPSKFDMLTLLRKGILPYVPVLVGVGSWLTIQRTTSWQLPLSVAVYPINGDGDGSERSAQYTKNVEWDSFKVIIDGSTSSRGSTNYPRRSPTLLIQVHADQGPWPYR